MAANTAMKIEEYESFLNERLRADLKTVLEQRDAINGELAEFLQLKATIAHLMERSDSSKYEAEYLKTMVDLGCNFYAKARVQDWSRITVSIGLGFYLEMKLDEALNYIEKKTVRLTETADNLSDQASQINARIKMVLGALDELQFHQRSE